MKPEDVQVNISYPIGCSLQDIIDFKKDDKTKELVNKCLKRNKNMTWEELDEMKDAIDEYAEYRMTNCPRVKPVIHDSTLDFLID